MKRRAFTLIEVAMVVFFTGILGTATLMLFMSWNSTFQTLTLQAQLKAEARLAAQRIFNLAAGRSRILEGQRGLRLENGSQIYWKDQKIWWQGRSLLSQPVRDFMVTRRDGLLHLTLILESRQRWRGAPTQVRFEFDPPLKETQDE